MDVVVILCVTKRMAPEVPSHPGHNGQLGCLVTWMLINRLFLFETKELLRDKPQCILRGDRPFPFALYSRVTLYWRASGNCHVVSWNWEKECVPWHLEAPERPWHLGLPLPSIEQHNATWGSTLPASDSVSAVFLRLRRWEHCGGFCCPVLLLSLVFLFWTLNW